MKHLIRAIAAVALMTGSAQAKPHAAALFCAAFPTSPSCAGSALACGYCHAVLPPALNSFGTALQRGLRDRDLPFPVRMEDMQEAVGVILDDDSDADTITNRAEIAAGTLPGSAISLPPTNVCRPPLACRYDPDYAYRKVLLGVCGEPADFDDVKKFEALPADDKIAELDKLLDGCVKTMNWMGKDGVVWEIGHYKIRPVGSVKEGEDAGIVPIVDYYDDYNLFVYTQIEGHDARDVLLADYAVSRSLGNNTPTTYTRLTPDRLKDGIVMQPEYRVGLVSSFWNLAFYLNYTAVARVLVAQAFNAYLGISLATLQGLNPMPVTDTKFKDYDRKGVERPECAMCHTTIDALAYPFRNYNGLTGTTKVLAGKNAPGLKSLSTLGTEVNLTPMSYAKPRLAFLEERYPGISNMPEAGYILGQRVENLKEWAKVLVNSDQFAANTVKDYWRVLLGHPPRPEETAEFQQLWHDFKTKHQYSVEAMLHDLIKTQAYGTP